MFPNVPFLVLLLLIFTIIFSNTAHQTKNDAQKNILFLISDDLRPVICSYANFHPGFDAPSMLTPNLDQLAKKVFYLKDPMHSKLCVHRAGPLY